VLNRKNALFAGHDEGAENWACIASLIETCKLNGVEPQAYCKRLFDRTPIGSLTSFVMAHRRYQAASLSAER